jgi:hypothetical protein
MNPNRLATVIAATVGWNQTRKKIAYYGSELRKIVGGDSDQRQPTLHAMWDSQSSSSAAEPPPQLSPTQQSRVEILKSRDIKGFGSCPSHTFLRALSFMMYLVRATFMFLWREQNIAPQVPLDLCTCRPPTILCAGRRPMFSKVSFDRCSRWITASRC